MFKISAGISGLFQSRKGSLCILILIATTFVCYKGMIDGTAWAATIATIYSIYTYAHSRAEVAAINHDK